MKYIVLTSMPDTQLEAEWNKFLADTRFATHYVTPNYFIDPYVRGDRFAVLASAGDGIAAVATGVFDKERIASGLFSRPQVVFKHGVDRPGAVAGLMNGIYELVERKPQLIDLYAWEKIEELVQAGLEVHTSMAETSVVMLDLSTGAEAMFAQFSQTRRNEIRKAERQRLIEIKEPETYIEQEALYRICCDWNARKGSSPGTFEQMKTAISQRENRRVFIAKVDGKTVAGSFYRFCPKGVIEYAANFSLPEYQKLRPNDLIGWHAIQWACSKGFSHFSMGGSHLFLRRFGGAVTTTYRYTCGTRPLGVRRVTERVREFGVETYRRLPENVRSGVRRVLAK